MTNNAKAIAASRKCPDCGRKLATAKLPYRYLESGLSNVVLQGVESATCPNCGESEVTIPQLAKVQRAIALALVNSPARLTGEQFRFLRKRLGLSGAVLARYLHTDKTKISKWETSLDRIGPGTDRLLRLLAAALDPKLLPAVAAVAGHLPAISDSSGKAWDLHVDIRTLKTSFVPIPKAA